MSWFRREPEVSGFGQPSPSVRYAEQEEKEITIYGDGFGEAIFHYVRFTMDNDYLRVYDEEGESAVFITRNIAGYSLA